MNRTWSALLLSLALAACESPTAWNDDLVIESQAAQTTEDSATVQGATGGAVVQGVYRAPGSGYTLRAYYQFSGAEVTLFVGGYPPADGGSRDVIIGHGYRIALPLSAGTYTVRVVHHDQGIGGPNSRDVASAEVTVARN
jgi:hypothetical protein